VAPRAEFLYVLRHLVPVGPPLIPVVRKWGKVRIECRPVLDAESRAEIEQCLDAALVVLKAARILIPGLGMGWSVHVVACISQNLGLIDFGNLVHHHHLGHRSFLWITYVA
jgi:hypothetical protein